ncbi:MAG: Maf family protein [Clostridia bacterium]|nr:Maf family protein [Clostridia bacterium]
MKIILASASPRRKSLMDVLGLDYEIKISDCEEVIDKNSDVKDIVMSLSLQKACDVAKKCNGNYLVIGADTVVAYENEILGKPKDKNDAVRMLKILSGNTHSVYTGFTIVNTKDDTIITDYEKSDVKFRELTEDEIIEYVNTNDTMDKAGSYSIQGTASSFVEFLDGDYNNVVGLPIYKLSKYLYNSLK